MVNNFDDTSLHMPTDKLLSLAASLLTKALMDGEYISGRKSVVSIDVEKLKR